MRSTRVRTKGFTLIASLMILLLLSGIAIGLMMMVNTEGKVGGADLANNFTYHGAEGGIEQMTSDLAGVFQTSQAPNGKMICDLSSHPPYIAGITWKDYDVRPVRNDGLDPCTNALPKNNGQIQAGPNQGLYAQIVPVSMTATAAAPGGQEVSMIRSAQVALIPVFQFGVFCDSDCSFFSGPNFDFAGRVHTNGDLYPEVGSASTLTFHDKISVYGNVVRQQLPNGYPTATDYSGTVKMPTAAQGCDGAQPACRNLGMTEGSVVGAGGNPPQSGQNNQWPTISLSNYNSRVIDGNYGQPGGTGAKKLALPFVGGGAWPFEIIRRPRATDSSALAASREYNLAQIRVLLSDDPAELPGGSGDPENVRLANVGPYQFGVPTSISASAFPPYPAPIIPPPPVGSTYNTYFATGTNGLPDESGCPSATSCGTYTVALPIATPTPLADWAQAPAAHPVGDNVVPGNAPLVNPGLNPAPTFTVCPPANTNPAGPPGCSPAYPYYISASGANASSWNLLDGWLRVEYVDNNGVTRAVTNEWLQLGFARGPAPPNAPGGNTVNPNAILILQQPADRKGDGNPDPNGTAPVCTKMSTGASPKCIEWKYGFPPEVPPDTTSTSPYYGVTSLATAVQSQSRFNWYPINLYDTREGETRDVAAGNNSCAATGVMNAVEIDVGNLQRWLWGAIPGSGKNVDYITENGWVLYFSDRRGMLPNPNPPYNGQKSGDSGLEDSINSGSAAGVPDNVLEPKSGGASWSPEDVNQNNRLDNFGPQNIGLGFYNVATNVNAGAGGIAGSNNPYLPRITSCLNTGRKNWVSGARHALKLVDGAFPNVPYRDFATQGGTIDSPGGFTVASENPVYVEGDYNSNAADPTWAGGKDVAGHAAASVIADSVTLLSNSWTDLKSFANPTTVGNRAATSTWYRLAIAGGKNMNFPRPNWGAKDYGTDGGNHNFLRYLENWGGQTLWYKGSLVSLYYSSYMTGVFKCCTVVYSPPIRNYSFDADFALPGGLPPGTPLFRDVDTLGVRQVFTARTN